MATFKIQRICLLGLFSFFILGCHAVTQDELNGTGLSPDPIFDTTRSMVIMPLQIPEGDERVKFVWAESILDNIIFNYLQFTDGIPGSLSNIQVKNASAIWDFYGATNPSMKKQVELLTQTIQKNKAHWLLVTPERKDQIEEHYQVPRELKIMPLRGKETPLYYFDKKMIVVQNTLSPNGKLTINVYDSLSSKTLYEETLPLKGVLEDSTNDQKNLVAQLEPSLKKILETLTQKKVFHVSIPQITKDLEVYVEGKQVFSDSLFLTQGKHRIFVAQLGKVVLQGTLDIQKDGELSLKDSFQKQKGSPLTIKTNPPHVPLFLDEEYLGLSPVTLVIPPGEYQLRASTAAYSNVNYILNIDQQNPLHSLELNLALVDQAYVDRVKKYRSIKIGTFFSGILSMGVALYSFERMSFYAQKISNEVDLNLAHRRYDQFLGATIGFGVLGAGLIVTSAIFQVLEYQARDVGIGVLGDGNLGIRYSF